MIWIESAATIAALMISGAYMPAAAQQTSSSILPTDAEVRTILSERVDAEHRNVGIVVGIITPAGRRIIAHGRTNANSSQPLDGDTVFEIGSVTKVFTSMLLADMVRRREVNLADPLSLYLPVDVTIRSNKGRTITLVDLATHTSGLPFWPSNIPATREGALQMATYSEAQLFRFLSGFDIPEDIGSKWAYSNIDAGLLGLALAHRAGSTFEKLLETRITGPLKMRSTAVELSAGKRERLAMGYDAGLSPAPAWNVPVLAAGGSLHSSTNDLLTFLGSLWDVGSPNSLLLNTMLETRRVGPGMTQALGWWIVSTDPGDDGIVTHDGSTLGFSSSIAYDPKTRTGVVVLSNTVNGVGDIARHLLRPKVPLTKAQGAAPQKTEIRVDPGLLDRYAGRYSPGPGTIFTVVRREDALMIQLPGIPPLRLRPETDHDFFIAENTRVTVTFESESDRGVTRLLLHSPSGDTVAARMEGR
jgi:CubicO group peptidase (beta-lactamase class C family)